MWKVSLNGRITANPVLDEEGSIYVTVNSSKIIKLTNNSVLSDSSMSCSISNITVGDDLTVEVEFDRDITGQITFKINDEIFNISSVTTENHIKLTVVNLKLEITHSKQSIQETIDSSKPVSRLAFQY